MIDGGLKVYYNGKQNSVFYPQNLDMDYDVGEMLLELYESDTFQVKDEVDGYLYRESEPSEENLTEAINSIFIKETEPDACVAWSMALSSFANTLTIFLGQCLENNCEAQKITSVGEFLDICVEEYLCELDGYKLFFEAMVARDSGDETEDVIKVSDTFEEIFGEEHKLQNIGYELIFDKEEKTFLSVYTVSNMLSLMALEYCHLIENNRHIRRCKNCGGYFLPKKRSDTVYCDRSSPQDSMKTCKQVGAQVAMQNKLASDECTQAYRKKYQALNMAYQRAANEDIQEYYRKKRECFKREGQKRKKMLVNGAMSTEEFLKWCENYT